ncbi:class I SAM-dependent methyltransferase [Eubacterium sp. am_0171]|uniref:class I SAM-dependent DNA methyltransferase n=1 Tax=unclassified Eubacterium (in: firmicutes) TaxID=2624479 RepID=UPI001020CD26|nr:class I SAM-dependent methyltransferase [Eubacterium sp. am_0171]MSC84776.1 methyltransferase domain-containing protein [Eubacterium sp. BIOML-A1]MSD08271.1 methyltransferase domain-containing protein [Eubacterium sp. BIOML-A2]RYT11426.1 class I SAM-dependent methyltransferase [Eubacterium sp. am_0171]
MEAYTSFASVYDTFMDDVPYEEWGEYLHGLLKEYGINDGLVLDLGCGTGTMTELLADLGYDMIGVDNSADMLEIALEKKVESGHDILYLLQDMRGFELYGTVRAIISICDSVNYITEPDELRRVFFWVNNYLDTDGVFIFDFNTEYKYREVLGDTTIAENREECSFIWDNYYYKEEQINEYELSLFIKDQESSTGGAEIYRRYQETHFQRGYTLEEMRELVKTSGLKLLAVYDAFTKEAPNTESERIYVIAGKGQRTGE